MQTILGANGTIGSVLTKELVNYTDKIRLVSRNPRKVNESDELFPADLSNPAFVDQAVEGSDVVYLDVTDSALVVSAISDDRKQLA